MPRFTSCPTPSPYSFYISADRHNHWIVREREDRLGGTFLTRQGAIRFALAETGGDASHVHAKQAPRRRARAS